MLCKNYGAREGWEVVFPEVVMLGKKLWGPGTVSF